MEMDLLPSSQRTKKSKNKRYAYADPAKNEVINPYQCQSRENRNHDKIRPNIKKAPLIRVQKIQVKEDETKTNNIVSRPKDTERHCFRKSRKKTK